MGVEGLFAVLFTLASSAQTRLRYGTLRKLLWYRGEAAPRLVEMNRQKYFLHRNYAVYFGEWYGLYA